MPARAWPLLLAMLTLDSCRPARPEGVTPPVRTTATRVSTDVIRARLLARIASTPGAMVGVAVRDLQTGQSFGIADDTVFHAASTMKVPVLFALYSEFQSGRLDRDGAMPLSSEFRSIVDGSPYRLSASDDSDSTLYARVGTPVPYRDLARLMITHSSNLATNALITRLDPQRITAQTREWGATRMQVLRGVEDNVAFRAGRNNTATAHDLVALFTALAEGRVGDERSTREMLSILEAQHFNDEIPAGLPPGTRVAHKTGWITAVQHDAGLVFPPRAPPLRDRRADARDHGPEGRQCADRGPVEDRVGGDGRSREMRVES